MERAALLRLRPARCGWSRGQGCTCSCVWPKPNFPGPCSSAHAPCAAGQCRCDCEGQAARAAAQTRWLHARARRLHGYYCASSFKASPAGVPYSGIHAARGSGEATRRHSSPSIGLRTATTSGSWFICTRKGTGELRRCSL
jgi:hypothetical protein